MNKLAICDDDTQICSQLESLLLDYSEIYQKTFDISIYYNGLSFLNNLHNKETFDFIILDICLQDTTGVEIGKQIRKIINSYDIPIIYISTFKDYALQLFKIRPFDFLLKPIKQDELFNVLTEIMKKLDNKNQFFTFKSGNHYSRIPYGSILYFYSNDKKVSIVTTDGIKEFWGKLKDVESQTNGYFLSIHKSFLINCTYLKNYTYDSVKMANDSILSISQTKRKSVRDILLKMLKEENL